MRKVLYVSGTRADYGLMRRSLKAIAAHPELALHIAATGMHLMPRHGHTLDEILADGFETHVLPAVPAGDSRNDMAMFVGECLTQLAALCRKLAPDVVLLLGDRGEMLAGAIAGAYGGIATAHVHGGEVTSTIDEAARHAISKLAHLHFAATEDSAQRLRRLGERPEHIFVVGAPGLDGIRDDLIPEAELRRQLDLDPGPFAVVVQHPVSEESALAAEHMRSTLEALRATGLQALLMYPNADAGGAAMIEVIEACRGERQFRLFPHLPRRAYLSLLACAALLIGNSSSGLIEAPSFGLPVLNLGSRQAGRLRSAHVLDLPHDSAAIATAIQQTLSDRAFLENLRQLPNPYGDGQSAPRIAALLATLSIDARLLQKQLTY